MTTTTTTPLEPTGIKPTEYVTLDETDFFIRKHEFGPGPYGMFKCIHCMILPQKISEDDNCVERFLCKKVVGARYLDGQYMNDWVQYV